MATYRREYYLKNRDKALSKAKEYYKKNKEHVLESHRLNKEHTREYDKNRYDKVMCENYRKRDIERYRGYARRWYQRHKNEIVKRKYDHGYYIKHKDRIKSNQHNARARKRLANGKLYKNDITTIKTILGVLCLKCGKKYEHLDHVIPLACGGSNYPTNIQPLCARCNTSKGSWSREDYRTSKQIKQILAAFQLELFNAKAT